MLSALIGVFFLGTGFGAPSHGAALEAMQQRFYNHLGEFVDPVSRIDDYQERFTDYPIDITLKNCTKTFVHPSLVRSRVYSSGYLCLVEVIPNGVPPFDVRGVFLFDGIQWRYVGSNKPRPFRPQEIIRKDRGEGEFILKPGALPYEGRPKFPLNDVESPYREILNLN